MFPVKYASCSVLQALLTRMFGGLLKSDFNPLNPPALSGHVDAESHNLSQSSNTPVMFALTCSKLRRGTSRQIKKKENLCSI